MEVSRTHDLDLYLKEGRYDNTKEAFKKVAQLLKRSEALAAGGKICDVGCAAGELLYYLNTQFPACKLSGLDIVPELLLKAKQMVPQGQFFEGSALDASVFEPASFDVVTLSGILGIFDDFKGPLDNALKWTKPGGQIYVIALFNSFPVDIWLRYRSVEHHAEQHREVGWNIFSERSISDYLTTQLGHRMFTFHPFEMPFDLEPNREDPIRTWTMRDENGRRLFTNGLSLICPLKILEITR